MKKVLTAFLIAGLVAGTLSGSAVAKKKKSSKPPAPIYLHGRGPVTEAYINETSIDRNYMRMDSTEPANPYPSSMNVTNYVVGPNTDCDGNGLLPFWRGDFTKPFKGDVTITLNTVGAPATQMMVELFSDPTGTCSGNETPATPAVEAPAPIASELVDVPPGPGVTEITFSDLKIDAVAGLGLQLSIPTLSPGQVRVLFDSPEFASGIFFK